MQRIIIIVLAILICLPFVIKSRVGGPKPASTAFSIVSSSANLVRISGDVRHPGLYPVGANVLAGSAIKMALPVAPYKRLTTADGKVSPLSGGEHVQLTIREDAVGLITVGAISSRERMVLGIPLDINSMNVADFDLLPGIGPIVAQRIMEYRQRNGGKMRVEQLLEVEGIGSEKYKAIMVYF